MEDAVRRLERGGLLRISVLILGPRQKLFKL